MIVERRSIVDAPAEQVWARVVTPEGINDELRPWMTMSMPRGKESLTVDDIPVDDGHFDRVICNQVLEHVPEPEKAVAELYRVLKPGGRIFLSAPLFFAEHQKPYDFFRYTLFAQTQSFFQGDVVERVGGKLHAVRHHARAIGLHLDADVVVHHALVANKNLHRWVLNE